MQTGTITAIYTRFSYDDGIDAESGSIEHQKQLLESYCEMNGLTNICHYSDDGYTGVNFNRPDFQRMYGDIKAGLVKTVVIKDMSRLGRNYLLVGNYTDIEFPKYNVRLIAVNDYYDSANGTNDLLPINNLMNEWYSRDISKKVKAMIKHKGESGQAISGRLPYGYYKLPDDKQNWIINEQEAEVVRLIFDLYLNQNCTMKEIADILKEKQIVRPKYHLEDLNSIAKPEDLYEWTGCAIKEILRRQEYAGDTVNFRRETISYKDKRRIRKSPDSFKIFTDTHPAIVSREIFRRVQEKYEKKFRHKPKENKYLLAEQVFCMDCHARMHGKKCNVIGGIKKNAYECTVYRKGAGCCFHGVPEEYLIQEVIKTIQRLLNYAHTDYVSFTKHIQKILDKNSNGTKAVLQSELENAQKRMTEIDKYIQGLFEAKVRGEIDGTLFGNLKKTYDEEKIQLQKVITNLIEKLGQKNEANEKIKILYSAIRKYDAVSELTPEVLSDFIERIEVGKFKTTFNVTSNRAIPFNERDNLISVHFWGVGIIDFIEK